MSAPILSILVDNVYKPAIAEQTVSTTLICGARLFRSACGSDFRDGGRSAVSRTSLSTLN